VRRYGLSMRDEILDAQDMRDGPRRYEPYPVSRTLAYVGLLQLAHGLIQANVIDSVKSHYGWVAGADGQPGAWVYDDADAPYSREVRARHKNVFSASCLWLEEMGALAPEDTARLEDIKAHRDEMVHETAQIIAGFGKHPDYAVFNDAARIFWQLDRFWRQVALDSGLVEGIEDGDSIDADAVESGSGIVMAIALQAFTSQYPL